MLSFQFMNFRIATKDVDDDKSSEIAPFFSRTPCQCNQKYTINTHLNKFNAL